MYFDVSDVKSNNKMAHGSKGVKYVVCSLIGKTILAIGKLNIAQKIFVYPRKI